MAKRKGRGSEREPTRAELKAFERRVASSRGIPSPAVTEEPVVPPPSVGAGDRRRGVLPSRPLRSLAVQSLSRDQELAFIQADLKRLTWLAVAMLILIVVLTFVIPLVVR